MIIECTGAGQVIKDSVTGIGAGGVVCLTGVGRGGSTVGPAVADIAAAAVLKKQCRGRQRQRQQAALVQGRGHVLASADRAWLARLVTRREPPEKFMHALQREPDDIKVVIQFSEA